MYSHFDIKVYLISTGQHVIWIQIILFSGNQKLAFKIKSLCIPRHQRFTFCIISTSWYVMWILKIVVSCHKTGLPIQIPMNQRFTSLFNINQLTCNLDPNNCSPCLLHVFQVIKDSLFVCISNLISTSWHVIWIQVIIVPWHES